MTLEINVETIRALAQILDTLKLDSIKYGDLEIKKSRHELTPQDQKPLQEMASILDEEDLLFHSTSAPALTPEQVAALAVNPPPVKSKKSKKDKVNA